MSILFLAACQEQQSDSLFKELNKNDPSMLMGTQIGNPTDSSDYELALRLNSEQILTPNISLIASDVLDCVSTIDVSAFETDLAIGNLLLTYFVLGERDDGFKRNFMHQVTGQMLFNSFGQGSNLSLRCQAVIYTPSYQVVFSETSSVITCQNCGGDQ